MEYEGSSSLARLTQLETRSSRPDGSCGAASRQMRGRVVVLQSITLAWMLIECGVALFSAWRAHSPALLAFGSDSFIELLSAIVVLLQFSASFRLAPERAARISGFLLFLLAGLVMLSSAVALARGVEAGTSWSGIAITIAALVIMPVLARAKRAAGQEAGNRALVADAVQSATCAYLAAVTLGGLLVNAFFHAPWVDPIAALAAIPIICIEGRNALRGETCGCCG
jgi:divalent metal cation (Fe/Co/Zn/Cd) transporter